MFNRQKKFVARNRKQFHALTLTFLISAFAITGANILSSGSAAAGACSTSGITGTTNHSITVPSRSQYYLWVRLQVPNNNNSGNTNGVHIEIDGNQCFIATTTNNNAVNQWQWVNSNASNPSVAHVTSQINSGAHNLKIIGKKEGIKVDKVLLLTSDSCSPSNDFTNGEPGENCTTPEPSITFTANPGTVNSGSSSQLSWSSTNATSCTASGGWTGTKNLSGTQSTGNLTSDKTYIISCSGPGGTSLNSVTVHVAPTLTFSANPSTVTAGTSSSLSWSSTNTTSCTASGGWTGARSTSGTQSTGSLTSTQTYTLTCTGTGGVITRNQTVTVQSPTDPPVINMDLDGISVPNGATSIVVNSIPGVDWRPTANSASGIKSLQLRVNSNLISLSGGRYTVGSTSNGDYTLQAVATDNNDRTTTKTLTVRVRHPDFNRNGKIDLSDVSNLLKQWKKSSTNYDINADGEIGLYDLSFTLSMWGPY